MDIAVAAIDPADPVAAEQAYGIVAAGTAADLPDFPPVCRQHFFGRLRHDRPSTRFERALAYAGGVAAGFLVLQLPQRDNLDNVVVDLTVHPGSRRRGVGRALHRYAVRRARELGRKRLVGAAVEGPSGGSAFAAAVGAVPALAEVRRRLDVSRVDSPALSELLAANAPRAAGYRVVRWHGAVPEEYVEDVAYLDARLSTDAPRGELAWEPEQVDAVRVRETEEAIAAWGLRMYHSGLRHEASGRLVAWTTLELAASTDWHAFQGITIVDPGHRGHRLGLIAKVENLRYVLAHEPALTVVDTWNAASNEHMIAINEALGFRPVDRWVHWQQPI
ncbi:Acetyltransferase (GNAT) family protein [Micromonospora pattaloongensis]|uniref:Acetyltransferase (GNAT) family protein n=1 Tax=Micromonospora pattaloongensis TaxID=405436 RepID=A0A1H3H334_9ACTN|nr:GNAT family N-acetyltransferase [Micromonospora pattaloongensis]SDY09049.1 Acetyltransferase (GNAT) family protein [Micromonospora pattaloongensis]